MGCGKKGTPAKHGGPQPPNPFIFELHLQWDLHFKNFNVEQLLPQAEPVFRCVAPQILVESSC